MRNYTNEQTILNGASTPQADFTAAVTGIITSSAHGLQNGDCIQLTTTTTLPAGLALTTNYYVIDATTDTFKVSATPGGTAVAINGTGTGTHTYHLKGKVVYVGDWEYQVIALNFIGTPTMTVKFQGSITETAPDFNAAQSYTNEWDYIEIADTEDGSIIDGDTGVACAGTADNRQFELNVSGLKWITVAITAWTTGNVSVKITNFD
jgi:hypothetical protein